MHTHTHTHRKQGNRDAGLIKAAHSPDFIPFLLTLAPFSVTGGRVLSTLQKFPPASTSTLHIPARPAGRSGGTDAQAHIHTPDGRHLLWHLRCYFRLAARTQQQNF